MANLGWGWPFPNIPANGRPRVTLNGQQYGHTGWIRPGSTNDYHDGFDFGAGLYNGNCLAVHPGTVYQIGSYTYWWFIWIKSPDGYNIIYQEGFRRSDIYVNVGQQVNVGTPLARVTQDHTHIGISNKPIAVAYQHAFMDDGTWLNPVDVIANGIASGGTNVPDQPKPQPSDPQQKQETKVITEDNSAQFIADAKKYLGVPYVWGGHNKANPWAGMDCSGYVSQVYHDYGIEIPAYTIAMEHNFREIPYSEVTTGDVAFFGPHGGTHHIELMLDHNTCIYEPQPGEVCKMEPISWNWGTWYGRNDEMHNKIFPTKTVTTTVTTKQDDSSSSDQASYYFQPFTVQDDHSIEMWGLHPGEDVQDDRFKDPDSMRKYALTQLVPDPVISVEVITETNLVPVPGEEVYLTIPEKGSLVEQSDKTTQTSYNTTVTVVGFTLYPFDPSQGTDITYDNLQASILHAQTYSSDLKQMEQLANAMLDRMPEVYYTKKDPTSGHTVKPGAIWANPYSSKELKEKGGDNNGGKHDSGTTNNSGTTDNTSKPSTGGQSGSTTSPPSAH